jgi:hypothetical protein
MGSYSKNDIILGPLSFFRSVRLQSEACDCGQCATCLPRCVYRNMPEYPPSSAGGMNGLPSPPRGEGLPRGVIQNTPQGKGEGEMIL